MSPKSIDEGPDPARNFTNEQLLDYDGKEDRTGDEKSIYIALKGIVFDASSANTFYGPGGEGERFAGKECGIELAKYFQSDLNMELNGMLQRLIDKYSDCYPILGKVVPHENIPTCERIVSKEELSQNDGSGTIPEHYASPPIFVAVKGKVFDVSFGGVTMYGKSCSYNLFAGKNVSRALAKMSFAPEDLDNTDVQDLSEKQLKTMEDWCHTFEFKKKYPCVGNV